MKKVQRPVFCRFCGRNQYEVHLIAGSGVYICDECIDVSLDILADQGTPLPTVAGAAQAASTEPSAQDRAPPFHRQSNGSHASTQPTVCGLTDDR
ncbi:MAG: hypothetical protein LBV73_20390 [Paraburkholderia sp.]|nr:hypothetical protein [Paraburkholderia sp.]